MERAGGGNFIAEWVVDFSARNKNPLERGQSRELTQFKKSHFSGTIVRGIEGLMGGSKKAIIRGTDPFSVVRSLELRRLEGGNWLL